MAYYDNDQNGQNVNPQGQAPEPQVEPQTQQAQPQTEQMQGQQAQTEQPQQAQPQPQYNNQGFNNYVDIGHSPAQIMVFGIVSLCASILVGWTVVFGILAIVFGALAMNWAKKFMMANPGVDDGQVKAGRITGIIGLIFGIIDVVGGLIAWLAIGCAAIFATAGGY